MTIHVHIERLILRGITLSPRARSVFAGALQDELGRRLAAGGVSPALQAGTALPRVSAPDIPFAATTSPAHLGRQVARALYAGIGRSELGGEGA